MKKTNIVPHTPALAAGTRVLPGDTPSVSHSPPVEAAEFTLRSNGTRLKDYPDTRKGLEMQHHDLIAKVVWLINTYPGWSEDGTFTFPNGETWGKLD